MAKIVIIVPVYNVEKYLDKCIKSILEQTYTNFDLILVDDGSDDKSGIMCDEYATKDSRIHVIHQKNSGVSMARNKGIDYVCNKEYDWVCFVDSDDCLDKRFLEILFNTGEKYNTDLVMCNYDVKYCISDINEKDIIANIMKPEEVYISYPRITNNVWAKLYRMNLISKHRFPEGKIMEDAHTFYKVLFDAKIVSVVNIPLYIYTINPNGIINSKWKEGRLEAVVAMENQVQFMKENHYKKALHTASYVLMLTIFKELKYLKETTPEKKKHEKYLRKKLRKAIHEYKHITGKSLKSEYWYYDYAYPFISWIYWKIKSLYIS